MSDTIPTYTPPESTHRTPPPKSLPKLPASPALPDWPAERLVAAVGRLPARLKRALDALAAGPQPLPAILAFFSSVWLGLLWLTLTAAYIAIGSGFASLRAHLEMTDLQFFDAWPMVTLMALLAVTLATVTIRRIPLTLYKAGVWTVHTGILVLLTGCFIYFSQKHEGLVRIFVGQTVNAYYDATERALYVARVSADDSKKYLAPRAMIDLEGMPIYYEHLDKAANPDGPGNPWTFPIPGSVLAQADPQLQDVSVRITGYYPYADMNGPLAAGPEPAPGQPGNPAIEMVREQPAEGEFNEPRTRPEAQWLLGNVPAQRIWETDDAPFGIEYLYHPTAQKIAEISASFTGQIGLTVRVPKFGIDRVYAAELNKPLAIDGTGYTLTPASIAQMPLRSKGYEGAMSTILLVDVVRKDAAGEFKFQRQSVSRFPERSPDFITGPDGKPKRIQDRIDNDIQIIFHDASRDQFWIVENDSGDLSLVHRTAEGVSTTQPMKPGTLVDVKVRGDTVRLGVGEKFANAVPTPRIVPPEFRDRGNGPMDVIAHSIVEVEVTRGAWKQPHIYVPFTQFANTDGPPFGPPPALVDVPNIGRVEIALSTLRRPLPADVTLQSFNVIKRPGAARAIEDWISNVELKDPKTGATADDAISLNHPAREQGLVYFQAAASAPDAPPAEQYTVLGVGNRPGTRIMITGVLLMITGILYAFYVKPVLLQARKRQLAAFAAAHARGGLAANQ